MKFNLGDRVRATWDNAFLNRRWFGTIVKIESKKDRYFVDWDYLERSEIYSYSKDILVLIPTAIDKLDEIL